MSEPTLFDGIADSLQQAAAVIERYGKVRHDHPDTSHAAARQIVGKARGQRAVLSYLIGQGDYGGTDEEMQIDIPMAPSTQRPRRVELVELALVKDSGSRRKTRSGRNAIVWVTTEENR